MNKPRFEVRIGVDPRQPWYFVLVAGNGKTICVSETYTRKASAINGITAIKNLAADALIVDTSRVEDSATAYPVDNFEEDHEDRRSDKDDSGRDADPEE